MSTQHSTHRPPTTATDGRTVPPCAPSPGVARAVGVGIALVSAAYALSFLSAAGGGAVLLAGPLFQCGLFALLWIAWRTGATGARRAGRALPVASGVLLSLAFVQSLAELVPGADAVAIALDLFWPLSMLGLFVVGISIAVVGRWRGTARIWAPVATSWPVVAVPAVIVLGQSAVGLGIGAGHLLLGYGLLGAVVAARPALVRS